MNEKLNEALDHISDRHIAQAAKKRPLPLKKLLAPLAAVLAVVILMNSANVPAQAVNLVAEHTEPLLPAAPEEDWDFRAEERTAQAMLQALSPFFREGSEAFLQNEKENVIWCPVSACLSLSMLAEAADGTTRQQLLDLLGTQDLSALRTQSQFLWEKICESDEFGVCELASSAWFDRGIVYDQSVMDAMAQWHYASIYQGDLDSPQVEQAMAQWLGDNTGGLLDGTARTPELFSNAVLTLASTALVESRWIREFQPSRSTSGPFHAPDGDQDVTYMNQSLEHNDYYWGESYGAVSLELFNGCDLWLILPDEGKTVADVLAQGEYWATVTDQETENSKSVRIDLSLPKFDVSSTIDLSEGLQAMGLTDIFSPDSDFSTGFPGGEPVYLGQTQQSSRVTIDEEGLTAASFTSLDLMVMGLPPDDSIDFILDRPFLFVLTATYNLPLFVGVVNQP